MRGAHAEEYADTVISTMSGFSSLSPEAQATERRQLVLEAEEAEDVPRHKKLAVMVGTTNYCVNVFPAKRAMSAELAAKVPSNSNAIEHQHSLLHHAVGNDHDLQPGVEKIYLHVREMEKKHEAIKGLNSHLAGCFDASDIRNRRPGKPHTWHENDGRAPDTLAALADLDRESTDSPHSVSTLPVTAPNPRTAYFSRRALPCGFAIELPRLTRCTRLRPPQTIQVLTQMMMPPQQKAPHQAAPFPINDQPPESAALYPEKPPPPEWCSGCRQICNESSVQHPAIQCHECRFWHHVKCIIDKSPYIEVDLNNWLCNICDGIPLDVTPTWSNDLVPNDTISDEHGPGPARYRYSGSGQQLRP
ncbi:hypothetical protein B0H13DRAFT_1904484 [Mycena leptocephala]|nr:hypothetical protein B0H13DRAFT_1904484 [Mycena leptocephala]